jgi:hypothetical protein
LGFESGIHGCLEEEIQWRRFVFSIYVRNYDFGLGRSHLRLGFSVKFVVKFQCRRKPGIGYRFREKAGHGKSRRRGRGMEGWTSVVRTIFQLSWRIDVRLGGGMTMIHAIGIGHGRWFGILAGLLCGPHIVILPRSTLIPIVRIVFGERITWAQASRRG